MQSLFSCAVSTNQGFSRLLGSASPFEYIAEFHEATVLLHIGLQCNMGNKVAREWPGSKSCLSILPLMIGRHLSALKDNQYSRHHSGVDVERRSSTAPQHGHIRQDKGIRTYG